MAISEKLSTLVQSQFPSFYNEEGENFMAFIKAYYEWMETTDQTQHELKKLVEYKDIDDTLDEYIEYFRRTVMAEVPENAVADKRLLAKHIKDFYQSKGTLASYKLLFRILYNEDVEVNYPADQILKISDGDWRIDRYVTTGHDVNNLRFIGKTIKGSDSGAEALVENIVKRAIRGRVIDQIYVSNLKGSFNHLEPIKLKVAESGTPHTPIIEAGIAGFTIVSPGGRYNPGDVVDIISSDKGKFGKIVVTKTVDLNGAITFSLLDGGSGYSSSINDTTQITLSGGDGSSPASFTIARDDLNDTFALSLNVNLVGSNTIFGALGPTLTHKDGGSRRADTFANTLLSQPDYGFQESGQALTSGINFKSNSNAVIVIANTSDPSVVVGDSLYGVTSGANATVSAVSRAYNSTDVILRVDGYKNFSGSEKVNKSTATGTTVGTVSQFGANTIGYHVLQFGNTASQVVLAGQELVGRTSGAFGVVKKVISTVANGYSRGVGGADDRHLVTVQVTANTTANLTSQFDAGPMRSFTENEGLRIVGANTTVGNVVSTTSNTHIENIHTKLSDALLFQSATIGTISQLSNRVGGAGFSVAPVVTVRDNAVAALGIGEQYLTLHYNQQNFGTSNSQILLIDTNDRVSQANTNASGDVMQRILTRQFANGTYETQIRVWQDELQRRPGNVFFANNQHLDIQFFTDASQSAQIAGSPGVAKIVSIQDEGVLGDNANISSTVGANGTITALRLADSGFNHIQNELVTIETTTHPDATSAQLRLTLDNVANSEGYYATSRSHISTKRGFIQDSRFYQEFSYEVEAAIALNKYRDLALRLVHPAGQALFGKFKSTSNVDVNVTVSKVQRKRFTANGTISISKPKASGTVSITNNTFNLSGSGTSLSTQFANGSSLLVESAHDKFFEVRLNRTTSATAANMSSAWVYGNISGANIYYANAFNIVGSSTTFTSSEFANGDIMIIETAPEAYRQLQLNKVISASSANLVANWTLTDVSGANAYYYSGNIT